MYILRSSKVEKGIKLARHVYTDCADRYELERLAVGPALLDRDTYKKERGRLIGGLCNNPQTTHQHRLSLPC